MAKVDFTTATFPHGSTAVVTATIPGFGTPKAAIVFLRSGSAESPNGTWIRTGMGFISTGNYQCSMGWSGQHNVTPTNNARSWSNSRVCYKTGEGNQAHFAALGSLVTDGIQFSMISWGDSNPYYADIILIGGDDVDARVMTAIANTATSVSGIGFHPNACFAMSSTINTTTQTSTAGLQGMFGAVVDKGDGNVQQRAMSFGVLDNTTAAQINSVMRQEVFNNQVPLTTATSMYQNFGHTSFTAAGVHNFQRYGTGTGSERSGHLYLRFANNDVWLSSFRPNIATDPEPHTYTVEGAPFNPNAMLQMYNHKVLDFTDPGVSTQTAVCVPSFWGTTAQNKRFCSSFYYYANNTACGNRGSSIKHICTTVAGVDNYQCAVTEGIPGGFRLYPNESFGDPGQGWAILMGTRETGIFKGGNKIQGVYRGKTPVTVYKGGTRI